MLKNLLAQLSLEELITVLIRIMVRLGRRGLLLARDLAAIDALIEEVEGSLDRAA